jgi:hypothetical protein
MLLPTVKRQQQMLVKKKQKLYISFGYQLRLTVVTY